MAIDVFAQMHSSDSQLHPQFLTLRDSLVYEPARLMLKELQQSFVDPDGNFVEQFQTAGFDARTFELFLYAMFQEQGHRIDRAQQSPDFLLFKNGVAAGVEAVVAAPPSNQGVLPYQAIGDEMNEAEVLHEIRHSLPVRLGSPLFSKLQKKYWEQPHMVGRPLVFAIQDFHRPGALGSSSVALSQYLYGQEQNWYFTEKGELVISSAPLDHHESHKRIPSGFFKQPDAEHVSAVLFCNTGTIPKFARMGQQGKHHCDGVRVIRHGFCYDDDPNAAVPEPFLYEVGDPEYGVETWREGTVLMHNPAALHPLENGWFGAAIEECWANNQSIATMFEPFVPYSSMTTMFGGHIPQAKLQEHVNEISRVLSAEYERQKVARYSKGRCPNERGKDE